MRTKRVALLCLPIVAASLQTAAARPAHADVSDIDSAQCSIAGSVSTFPGPVLQAISFSGSMVLNCSVGIGDERGTWTLTMSGQVSPGFCAGGRGLANVSGNGPDGSFGGTMEIVVNATSWDVTATLDSNDPGGDALHATLQATPTSGVPCVNASTTMNLSGQGSISDLQPPPDEVECTVSGHEAYNPGLTAALISYAVNVSWTLSCPEGTASDDIGTWTATLFGNGSGDCGEASGDLGVTGGSSPHDGAVGGAVIYNRVGTMLEVEGDLVATHDHSTFAWLTLAPSGNCATVPWSSSSVSGAAVLEGA